MEMEQGVQFGDLAGIIKRRAGLVGLVAGGVFLAAVFIAAILPNEYEATRLGRNDDKRVVRYSLRARWRMTERIAFTAYASLYDEQEQRAGFNVRDAQRVFGWLGVEYKFKPIQF